MAKRKASPPKPPAAPAVDRAAEYTVLARRYRPQQFRDLVGQEPVARALMNALESHRVAHAYLFTGARGVGKTSTARILAKALNCVEGPTPTPCDRCDPCRRIATGEDVDVLEIDGASNRGIDEVREIRQNVQYRPARARYKIYIIDEVHMLTQQAFNALLKTLEEPPAHVKFIFATTEAQKIPVTILSRCQRFDFASITVPRIVEQLRQIAMSEGVEAEDAALELIGRRAGGSMRDAQSLLDQLLAFGSSGGGKLTAEQVHRVQGTAHAERIAELAAVVLRKDAKSALDQTAAMADEGVQFGEMLDQLIDYWRDLMVVHYAGSEAPALSVPPGHRDTLVSQAKAVSLDTILAGIDLLAAAKSRMRMSGHPRVLVETALVRLCRLEELMPLAELAAQLGGTAAGQGRGGSEAREGMPAAGRRPASATPQSAVPTRANPPRERTAAAPPKPTAAQELTEGTLGAIWARVLEQMGPLFKNSLEKAGSPAILGPKTLVLRFGPEYNLDREYCQDPARLGRMEDALRKATGQAWSIRIDSVSKDAAAPSVPAAETEPPPSRYRRQRTEAMQQPLVKRAAELFGAHIVSVDEGFGATPAQPVVPPETADAEET